MSTLVNVEDQTQSHHGICTGIESVAIPEAKHSQKGVSVKYVQDNSGLRKWFVFRASYGREIKAVDSLILFNVYAYVAVHKVVRREDGKLRQSTEPLVNNLVFAYLTKEEADVFVYETPELSYLSYYYDHFQVGLDYFNPPLIVPDDEMINFILATHTQNEHIKTVRPEYVHFRSNDEVVVTDGEFKGVHGRVARVSGQQRVIVTFLNNTFIATAYIPTALLKKIAPK